MNYSIDWDGPGESDHDTDVDRWDEWYRRLPEDLRKKLSLHDFKRLGDLFSEVFGVL